VEDSGVKRSLVSNCETVVEPRHSLIRRVNDSNPIVVDEVVGL